MEYPFLLIIKVRGESKSVLLRLSKSPKEVLASPNPSLDLKAFCSDKVNYQVYTYSFGELNDPFEAFLLNSDELELFLGVEKITSDSPDCVELSRQSIKQILKIG